MIEKIDTVVLDGDYYRLKKSGSGHARSLLRF
jgi:hypothetical protein